MSAPPRPPAMANSDIAKEGKDVICQRGELAKNFNTHYRDLIRTFYPAYALSSSCAFKRQMAEEITSIIRKRGGRFLKSRQGPELSNCEAQLKVLKALKDFKRQDPAHKQLLADAKKKKAAEKEKSKSFSNISNKAPALEMLPPAHKITAIKPALKVEKPTLKQGGPAPEQPSSADSPVLIQSWPSAVRFPSLGELLSMWPPSSRTVSLQLLMDLEGRMELKSETINDFTEQEIKDLEMT